MSDEARRSFGTASVHVGADWQVRCSAYPREAPILTVDAGCSSVTVTIAGRGAPGEPGVAFARDLAAQAARFAAECERLHAQQQAQTEAAGDSAA